MNRLQFAERVPIAASQPERTDVACFVGLLRVRGGDLPPPLLEWLQRYCNRPERPPADLLNVPVPLDDWAQFDRLFAWDERPLGNDITAGTYVGVAVRSFFAEGGRRCYVVRVGDPLPVGALAEDRMTARARIVPFLDPVDPFDPAERATWQGVHHLTGLPDVSFLSLPDLPELFSSAPRASQIGPSLSPPFAPIVAPVLDTASEQFVECSEPVAPPAEDTGLGALAPPRSTGADLNRWRELVARLADFLARRHREVQLVASLPLAMRDEPAAVNLNAFAAAQHWFPGNALEGAGAVGFESRFVQLTYPWLETVQARALPGLVEPPEGPLLGMLARNALTRGSYRSATKLKPLSVLALEPALPRAVLHDDAQGHGALVERVSVWGETASGVELASDVTTSALAAERPASVARIIGLVVRSARVLGEDVVFEPSGEALWRSLEQRLGDLLRTLFNVGALDGESERDAYTVRCGRATMTQNDIDNGRVIAELMLRPAASIELIRVSLTLQDSGRLILREPEAAGT